MSLTALQKDKAKRTMQPNGGMVMGIQLVTVVYMVMVAMVIIAKERSNESFSTVGNSRAFCEREKGFFVLVHFYATSVLIDILCWHQRLTDENGAKEATC